MGINDRGAFQRPQSSDWPTLPEVDPGHTHTIESLTGPFVTCNIVDVVANFGVCLSAYDTNDFYNSSAAPMTIELAIANPVPVRCQRMIVRIYDYSYVAQGLTFENAEPSSVTLPTLSNGSVTSPLSTGWNFNQDTGLWRLVAVA